MLIRWLYTLVLTCISPFLLFGLYKKKEGRVSVGSRWKEHFGVTPTLSSDNQPIWIHAVSVGETIAATLLIKELKAIDPDLEIVLTTTTPTGAEQAEKIHDLATHRYMPLDFPFAVKGFIKAVKPSKMVIMETELWPNTLHIVAKNGIPISVVNARLSERSCERYAKVQPIFNLLSENLHKVLCQYTSDAERFIKLGVAPHKVGVTGSIKFDINIEPDIIAKAELLRVSLGSIRPIWIAASTHSGEEENILLAHQEILESYPDAMLILVPRHPERFNSVFELCCEQGFSILRRTEHQKGSDRSQVYLGDTMGELLTLIGASDICFMGGSLIGDKVGGHNFIEPAALKKPIITGPSFFNFSDIAKSLIDNNALYVECTANSIAKRVCELFSDEAKRRQRAENAYNIYRLSQGSLQKTIREL